MKIYILVLRRLAVGAALSTPAGALPLPLRARDSVAFVASAPHPRSCRRGRRCRCCCCSCCWCCWCCCWGAVPLLRLLLLLLLLLVLLLLLLHLRNSSFSFRSSGTLFRFTFRSYRVHISLISKSASCCHMDIPFCSFGSRGGKKVLNCLYECLLF